MYAVFMGFGLSSGFKRLLSETVQLTAQPMWELSLLEAEQNPPIVATFQEIEGSALEEHTVKDCISTIEERTI